MMGMDIKSFVRKLLKNKTNPALEQVNQNRQLSSLKVPEQYRGSEPIRMKELASLETVFCKISQSSPGLSAESHYIEYQKNTIVTAKDKDEWLSFVPGSDIIKCLCYGDTLTIFNFDLRNKDFQDISDDPVIYKGGMLSEYIAKNLLVKENYSLQEPSTFVKIIELSSAKSIWYSFTVAGEIADRMKQIGCVMTADFVETLEYKFNLQNPEIAKELKECIQNEYQSWKEQIEQVMEQYYFAPFSPKQEYEIDLQEYDEPER